MKKTRRAHITIERERLLIVSSRRPLKKRCGLCGTEVRMIDIDEASALAAVTQREIFLRVENGSLHYAETSDGVLLICLESLRQSFFGANDADANQKIKIGR
jgi:hypothetical protein